MNVLVKKKNPCEAIRIISGRCQYHGKGAWTAVRHTSTSVLERGLDVKRTRNIGIIAHIDAGKTTTTERMLYYSGYTRRIGDVDDGSTVTDFLPAERARGITIQSAAVTFNWPPSSAESLHSTSAPANLSRSRISHTINLIDTPGHADFTFEVLRSLRILDGAICILDGVAGVEAQTEKVWAQANNYSIPRIIFVNKLDRDGAAFGRTVKEIGSRLKGMPAVCQIPWWEQGKGRFMGVGDAIDLCALKWEEAGDGKHVQRYSLEQLAETEGQFADEIRKARTALVESLCDFDEELLSLWLDKNDDSLALSPNDIRASLRRCILDGSGKLVPVFAGASFRNIGVQPLLDAVNDLLPDPTERPSPEVSLGDIKGTLSTLLDESLQISPLQNSSATKRANPQTSLVANIEACALAFKVVNDPRRGVLVYIRVYSGSVKRNAALWNTNLDVTERAQRLLQMYASEAVEISSIPAGQIGVIAGLKYARTGDTLVSYPGVNPKTGPPAPINNLQLRPIDVPPPVFFSAVEPHSLSEEKNVADILTLLLREDPSLHVNVDEESGQMLLSGMGELHLEIARDRLVKDFKAKASMGNIEIGYRECIMTSSAEHRVLFDRDIAGRQGKAACSAIISPLDLSLPPTHNSINHEGNVITISRDTVSSTNGENPISLPPQLTESVLRTSLMNGTTAALARGPRRSFPLHSVQVSLSINTTSDLFGTDSTPAALTSAARLAVLAALRELASKAQIGLMEPVMHVVISCDEKSLGAVVHDLSAARGGQVLSLDDAETASLSSYSSSSSAEPSLSSSAPAFAILQPIPASRIYAPPDPFGSVGKHESQHDDCGTPGQLRHVVARVPLKEMVGYLKHLRSLTGGRGTFVMAVDRFERLTGVREKALL